jgi:hypothetical protein
MGQSHHFLELVVSEGENRTLVSRYESNRRDPTIFGRFCLDPEGNLIERGMAAEFEGRTYVVGYAARSLYDRSPVVCLDGLGPEGRLERIFLSGLRLRLLRIVGHKLPLVFG